MAAIAAGAIVDAPQVIAQPKVQWRMSTTWTKGLDHLQGAAQQLARVVEETSGGQFRIEVFPGGQIMQPFECFEATAQGKIEVFKAGGTAVLTPAAEIYAALERGVIDAVEWVGPHDDMKLGLHKSAQYYYPGRHEPGTMAEFGFNRKAYEALPIDLRRTLDHAAAAVQVYGLTEFHSKNAIALERLKTEFKGKVEVLQLPVPVLRDLKKLATEVAREESEKTPMARKVHASFSKFHALVGPWDHVAEGAYHQLVAG